MPSFHAVAERSREGNLCSSGCLCDLKIFQWGTLHRHHQDYTIPFDTHRTQISMQYFHCQQRSPCREVRRGTPSYTKVHEATIS